MKYYTLPIIAALVASLFAGCSKGDNGVQIISAVYGSGTSFADVSTQVSSLIRQASGFEAHPGWLKADPTPGWNKTLVIVYEVKGQRHILTTSEGGKVTARILLDAARP